MTTTLLTVGANTGCQKCPVAFRTAAATIDAA